MRKCVPSACQTLLLLAVLAGCGQKATDSDTAGARSDLFGEPVHTELLEPFQGGWTFDFERTAALWESQGVPAEQIAAARQLRERSPEFFELGQTLQFKKNIATGVPFEFSEYRFFGLHEHDGAVCGKAWHHEDAGDPGDMSKCRVKLRRVGDELHFDLWMAEGYPDLNDPDLLNPPAVESGSAAECDAPADDAPERGGWSTSVYTSAKPR